MRSIFVSSTFRDMQSERDLLHIDIIPALNSYAEKYQDYLHFIDLRWGVNTRELDSDESAHKVLNVCLDEIDKSQPYMLIFIGDRYGWIPDRKYIEKIAGCKDFCLDDSDRSVTALEIEYGLLAHVENAERCIICIRNPLDNSQMDEQSKSDYACEDEVHKTHLEKLKLKLKEQFPDQIIYYDAVWDHLTQKLTGLDDLREQIIKRFLSIFMPEWSKREEISTIEKISRAANHRLKLQTEISAGNDAFIDIIAHRLFEENKLLLYLKGTPGSGKTTLLCQSGFMLAERNCRIYPFFCASNPDNSSLHDLLSYMIRNLEIALGFDEYYDAQLSSVQFLQKYFSQLTVTYESNFQTTLIFLIDDIHKLVNDGFSTMFFLPDQSSEKIRFFVTSPDDFDFYAVPGYQSRSDELFIYGLAYPVQARLMIYNLLDRYHKELDVEVIDAIIDRGDCYNPLYISLLINRLLMMDSSDLRSANNAGELTAQMIRIVEQFPSDTGQAAWNYLMVVGEKIAPAIAQNVFALLSIAPKGLREHDLEQIFRTHNLTWSTVDFTRLMLYLSSFINHKDSGFVCLSNQVIANGFLSASGIDKKLYYSYLFEYIRNLSFTDALRQESGLELAFLLDKPSFLADEFTRKADNPKILEKLSRLLIQLLRKYGIDTMCEAIKLVDSKENYSLLASFLCENFYPLIDKTDTDLHMGIQIFSTLVEIGESKFADPQDLVNWLGQTIWVGIYIRFATLLDSVDNQRSVDMLIKAADIAKACDNPIDEIAKIYSEVVENFRELYRRTNQIDNLRTSLDYMNKLLELKPGKNFYEHLAIEMINLGEYLLEKLNDSADLKRIYLLKYNFAVCYYVNKRWQEAYDQFLASVRHAQHYLRIASELDAYTINQIAEINRQLSVLLNEFNEMEPAITFAGRAVELFAMVWEKTRNDDAKISFSYALSIGCLAENYAKIDDFDKSKKLFFKQLEVFEILGKLHPQANSTERLINCLKNLYVVHIKTGEEEQAWAYRRRAESMME